ncbi:MAG: CBS domain-containing protein [Syntrophomonadaceae bacterium]
MEIITSHNALDFDGLASMVAASKLYPGAIMVIPGTMPGKIKQFMALYKDVLDLRIPRELELSRITRVIMVDTASPRRLAQLEPLHKNRKIDFHVYDHHPPQKGDIAGSITEVHATGATTTIMVEKIIADGLEITPFEATILALGIYEDTGSLLFPGTTERDARAVAFLLQKKANLKIVASFMDAPISDQQRKILQSLIENTESYHINGLDITLAIHQGKTFIPGLDLLAYRIFKMEECDAIFVIAQMQGKVYVIARSGSSNLKVNEILTPLGGSGHERAASAMIRGKDTGEVTDIILKEIRARITPPIVARDIMSTPVKTIDLYRTMEEAGRLLLRYGHTGMPVVDGDVVVGVISRRDADKAVMHNLGHAPVKGFMTSKVITVAPDTPLSEIQKMVVEYDVGRLPVVDRGCLVGIVSRTDILRILHGEDYPEDHTLLFSQAETDPENIRNLMQGKLPADIFNILEAAGEVARELEYNVYCVGGFVRDLFLNVPNFDVDLVVEGDGRQLARHLADRLGGRVRVHDRFATATFISNEGTKIDVATARTEYYEFPAALPMVERSSIKEDMYRRDFTINTLAVCLNPGRFGELIDYFGGRRDIQKRLIRILYNLSFVEDPTRILRAIRFEQRYKFTIELDTLRFARDAIKRRMLGKLSYKRILRELILILSEKDPIPALMRMTESGVWTYILPEVDLAALSTTLKRIPMVLGWWEERYYGQEIKPWLVYLLVIFSPLDTGQLADVLNRYPLDRYAQRCVEDSVRVSQIAVQITGQTDLKPSQLDSMLEGLNVENMIYLLLLIKSENTWENIVRFYDLKAEVKVEINGHDLQELGLKAGPIFKTILVDLYEARLDGNIKNRDDEIKMVKQWIDKGRFQDAMAN